MFRLIFAAVVAVAFVDPAVSAPPKPLTAAMFDVTSKPKGAISEAQRKRLWTEYTRQQQCFVEDHASHVQYTVRTIKRAEWATMEMTSPFPAAITGLPACGVTLRPELPRDIWNPDQPPEPIVEVGAIKKYGDQLEDEQVAAFWFDEGVTTLRRQAGDPKVAAILSTALVKWAKANALSKNQYDGSEFKFPVTLLIEAMQNAFFEVANTMTPDDRTVLGTYLNKEIAEVERAGTWRPSNHDNLYAYMGALWGLAVNDRTAVQEAINTYKRNIQDMRPDGSWPIELATWHRRQPIRQHGDRRPGHARRGAEEPARSRSFCI